MESERNAKNPRRVRLSAVDGDPLATQEKAERRFRGISKQIGLLKKEIRDVRKQSKIQLGIGVALGLILGKLIDLALRVLGI